MNFLLPDLNGFEQLDTIGGSLIIQWNEDLEDLTALSGLTSVPGLLVISDSDSLLDLSGLENINFVEGDIVISNNGKLSSITQLSNLNFIGGGLTLFGNDSLTNLTGLDNVNSIGGILHILYNAALFDLTGLGELDSIEGDILIMFNSSLTSLSGIDNISPNSINGLSISYNPYLYHCEVQSVCDYLAAPYATVEIYDNAPGCNSEEEVEAACRVGIDESAVGSWQFAVKIYPNPSSSEIIIEIPESSGKTDLAIFNLSGREMARQQISNPLTVIDISHLAGGVYFVKVKDERKVRVGKFVKQ